LQVPLSNFHLVSITVASQAPDVVLKHSPAQADTVLQTPVSNLNNVVVFVGMQVNDVTESKHCCAVQGPIKQLSLGFLNKEREVRAQSEPSKHSSEAEQSFSEH